MDEKTLNILSTCPPLYNVFHTQNLPRLNIGTLRSGNGQINFIKPEGLLYSILYGYDVENRLFICVRVKCNKRKKKKRWTYNDLETKEWQTIYTVGVFYKRYIDSDIWAYASHNPDTILYHDSTIRKENYDSLEKRLKKLCSGKSIYSIDFGCSDNTQPFDITDGNGMWELTLI